MCLDWLIYMNINFQQIWQKLINLDDFFVPRRSYKYDYNLQRFELKGAFNDDPKNCYIKHPWRGTNSSKPKRDFHVG